MTQKKLAQKEDRYQESGSDLEQPIAIARDVKKLYETIFVKKIADEAKKEPSPTSTCQSGNNPTSGHSLAASSAPSRIATFASKPLVSLAPPITWMGIPFPLKREPKSSKGSCPAAIMIWSTSKS